jgi:Holliday junction resolvase RusA-like endonuclease
MPEMVPLVRIWVPGRPRTKGHLKPVGARGRKAVLRETNPDSGRWRQNVAEAARQQLAGRPAWHGGVVVRHTAHFVNNSGDATEFELGDLDTLERNVGDALKDAGVYSDDSKVICWISDKIAHKNDGLQSLAKQGSVIAVWPAPYFTDDNPTAKAFDFSERLTRGLEMVLWETGHMNGVWYGD